MSRKHYTPEQSIAFVMRGSGVQVTQAAPFPPSIRRNGKRRPEGRRSDAENFSGFNYILSGSSLLNTSVQSASANLSTSSPMRA